MSADDFNPAEAHLLTHAAAMGGWLSTSYSLRGYDWAIRRLLSAGYFRLDQLGGKPVHRLTSRGSAAAARLGAAR